MRVLRAVPPQTVVVSAAVIGIAAAAAAAAGFTGNTAAAFAASGTAHSFTLHRALVGRPAHVAAIAVASAATAWRSVPDRDVVEILAAASTHRTTLRRVEALLRDDEPSTDPSPALRRVRAALIWSRPSLLPWALAALVAAVAAALLAGVVSAPVQRWVVAGAAFLIGAAVIPLHRHRAIAPRVLVHHAEQPMTSWPDQHALRHLPATHLQAWIARRIVRRLPLHAEDEAAVLARVDDLTEQRAGG
jgi:hypothetical protein